MCRRRFCNTFSGKTAALLGGGPSLDDMIPWVREHQHDLVIIAVSRICRRLREAGITPHIVVSIDPTEFSFDISKEFLDLDPRSSSPTPTTSPSRCSRSGVAAASFSTAATPGSTDEDENISAAGPTVTNTGFALAMAMGFSTIVFAGIDLCHSIQGYTHGEQRIRCRPETRRRQHARHDQQRTYRGDHCGLLQRDLVIQRAGPQRRAGRNQGHQPLARCRSHGGSREYIPLEQLQFSACENDPFELLHARIDGDAPEQRLRNYAAMQRELGTRAHGRLRRSSASRKRHYAVTRACSAAPERPPISAKGRMDKIERKLDDKFNDPSIVRMFSAQAFPCTCRHRTGGLDRRRDRTGRQDLLQRLP